MESGFEKGNSNSVLFFTVVVAASIIWCFHALAEEEKPEDKINPPSINGLDKGVYLVVTVDLEQVILLRKPRLFMEVSVFETDRTMDEIKSCWVTGMKDCFRKRAEDYVDEFLEFYRDKNQEQEDEDEEVISVSDK